jgi:uncharacterized repeat protein (TIGR03803 family)
MKFDLAKRITTLALAVILGPAVNLLPAQTFTVLHTFVGPFFGNSDGADPSGDLILVNGVLYGTTEQGGTVGASYGDGTVYKVTTKGVESVIYTFGTNIIDGKQPEAGLVRNASGNLYGTTYLGGTTGTKGTVFKVTGKKEKLLHSFLGVPDGETPMRGNMVMDSAGNLYGVTNIGGKGACYAGCGTVFKISTAGKTTILHHFQKNNKDGVYPAGGLIIDSANNLYGTTTAGGNTFGSLGTIYRLTTTGKEKILHNFQTTEGAAAESGLVRDAAGNLYGTTYGGGIGSNGTVYKLSPAGHLTTLYGFSGLRDGGQPWSGLVLDPKGNVYGTTSIGGGGTCSTGCGVIFKVTPTGNETVLHAFNGTTEGFGSYAGLVRDSKGNLYGTDSGGGDGYCNCGVVFKLAPK